MTALLPILDDDVNAHSTVRRIYEHYEAEAANAWMRPHLGASEIGHACERALWYSFRWAARKRFNGRMLRLFETGNMEEIRLARELAAIGIEIHTLDVHTGKQIRVSAHGGHFGGSMDGRIRGLVEAPATWHVFEAKTHNAKSWRAVASKGVRAAKPTHYAQMQIYMGLEGLTRAAYFAVNKDDDQLYLERIAFEQAAFDALMAKTERIVFAAIPPDRISSNPDSKPHCAWCDYRALCHGLNMEPPLKNCRTCLSATPEPNGTWTCAAHDRMRLTDEMQEAGCSLHLFIPQLITWGEQVDVIEEESGQPAGVVYAQRDGTRHMNEAGTGLFEQV